MATIRLERAARYTGPNPVSQSDVEPHKLAAWNWLQEQLTPEQVQEFEEMFRAGPPPTAPAPPKMPAWLEIALPLLRESEGLRLEAYPDPVSGGDPWTIGYGTTRYNNWAPVRRGDRITKQQAEDLLALDAQRFASALTGVLPWERLNDPQRAALVSWAYNVGAAAALGSTLVRRLKAGEDPATVARAELPRWNKGMIGGRLVEVPGLTNRRKRELEVFLAGSSVASAKPTKPAKAKAVPVAAEGMIGPGSTPQDHGFQEGDYHLVVNDRTETARAYSFDGTPLWEVPALARGQGADTEYQTTGSDTPPGLYMIGDIYRDYERVGDRPDFARELQSYGWFSFDLVELEGQEKRYGRAGVMIHGGGTACGWPGAWAPRQPLYPTLGCIRMHNADLRDKLLPLTARGRVFVSTLQERA